MHTARSAVKESIMQELYRRPHWIQGKKITHTHTHTFYGTLLSTYLDIEACIQWRKNEDIQQKLTVNRSQKESRE